MSAMTLSESPVLGPIVTMYCCRAWPVAALYRVGKCGLCGKRPHP